MANGQFGPTYEKYLAIYVIFSKKMLYFINFMSTFLFLCEHCFGKVAFTARLKAMYKARRALYIGLEAVFFWGGGGAPRGEFQRNITLFSI